MWRKSHEIAAEMESIRAILLDLDGMEDPTEEQVEQARAELEKFTTLETEHSEAVAREEKLERVRSFAIAHPEVREKGSQPDVIVRTKRDPFEGFDRTRSGLMSSTDLRARALDAIEQAPEYMSDAGRERATELVERTGLINGTGVARHILTTGSPEYHEAFRAYLDNPDANASRAALSLANANGGYLVPFTLDPSIMLTNAGSMNPFRQLATIKTITTDDWNGVTSAGVNAEWLAEGTEAADATPTFGTAIITPKKAAAWVYGSFEILADSDFGAQFPALLSDAKDRLEEAAFATGNGTTQPAGAVTRAATVTAAGTAAYAVADVYTLQASLPVPWAGQQERLRRQPRDHQPDPPVRHLRWRRVLVEPGQRAAAAAHRLPDLRVDDHGVGPHHRQQDPAVR